MTGLPETKFQLSKYINLTPIIIGVSVWTLCLFPLAELLDVFEVSEAREGVVVDEIVRHDTWLLPLRHGEIVPSKPPLFHIIAAGLTKITGEFTEFELRLPSLIAAIISLIATYLFVFKLTNPLTAFSGAAILGTTYGFLQLSIDGRVDMLFNTFYLLAYYLFTLHIINKPAELPDRTTALLLSLSLVLSVFTKGPLGLVLFVLYSVPVLYIKGSIPLLKRWYLNPVSALTVFTSGAWYIATVLTGKDGILSRHILFENIQRFFGNSEIPAKPFWYYFLYIWTQSMPWGVIGLIILAWMYFSDHRTSYQISAKQKEIIKTLFVQSLAMLLFLSLASGKRRAYLLIILPLLSIQMAILFYPLYESVRNRLDSLSYKNMRTYLSGISISIVLFTLLLTLVSALTSFLKVETSFVGKSIITGFLHSSTHAFLTVFLLCLLLFFLLKFFLKDKFIHGYLYAIFCLVLQGYLAFPVNFYITKGESHSYMEFAESVKSWKEEHQSPKITFIKKRLEENFDTFFYYYGERMQLQEPDSPLQDGYYIARKSWLKEKKLTEDSAFTSIMEGGKRKDRTENYIVLFQYDAP